YPGMSRVDRLGAPDVTGRSFAIRAVVDKTASLDGVLLAWGSRFGGLSFYVKAGRLTLRYVFSQDESMALDVAERAPAGRVVLNAVFDRRRGGSVRLTLDGTGLEPASTAIARTWPTHGLTAGLSCGEDRGHPV